MTGIGEEVACTRGVVVLNIPHLDVVAGEDVILVIKHIDVIAELALAFRVSVEIILYVVRVFHVKSAVQIGVSSDRIAGFTRKLNMSEIDRLGQPDGIGIDLRHRFHRLFPEFNRNAGSHVAPESVYNVRPLHQRFDLIIPQFAVGIIEIQHVGPIAVAIAEAAVLLAVEVFGMLTEQHRIVGGVVVNDVDNAAHSAGVYFAHKML